MVNRLVIKKLRAIRLVSYYTSDYRNDPSANDMFFYVYVPNQNAYICHRIHMHLGAHVFDFNHAFSRAYSVSKREYQTAMSLPNVILKISTPAQMRETGLISEDLITGSQSAPIQNPVLRNIKSMPAGIVKRV